MKTAEVETTTKWALDKAHSTVEFKAKHLMISTVRGTFKEYDATVETNGDDWETAKITFTADVASITTGDEKRDGHLKGADFFDVEKFPKLTFVSTGIEKTGADMFKMNGNLTIHDVTKPIVADVKFEGSVKDPWGNTKAGFAITAKLNRKDYGLKWNVITEAGSMLVSEEVNINCSVQLARA